MSFLTSQARPCCSRAAAGSDKKGQLCGKCGAEIEGNNSGLDDQRGSRFRCYEFTQGINPGNDR